eukprot:7477126-Alexandrium_andersonii.AAC.1
MPSSSGVASRTPRRPRARSAAVAAGFAQTNHLPAPEPPTTVATAPRERPRRGDQWARRGLRSRGARWRMQLGHL